MVFNLSVRNWTFVDTFGIMSIGTYRVGESAMHLLVLAAITASAGTLIAALAGKRQTKEPVPVRVRAIRRPD
jgi:hypothetical protein